MGAVVTSSQVLGSPSHVKFQAVLRDLSHQVEESFVGAVGGVFHGASRVEDHEAHGAPVFLASDDPAEPLDHLTARAAGGHDDAEVDARYVDAFVEQLGGGK